jgi:hypothetical protein
MAMTFGMTVIALRVSVIAKPSPLRKGLCRCRCCEVPPKREVRLFSERVGTPAVGIVAFLPLVPREVAGASEIDPYSYDQDDTNNPTSRNTQHECS